MSPSCSHRGAFSFAVSQTEITHFGLHSLREISDGDVVFTKNMHLCYSSPEHWKRLFKSERQTVKMLQNADAATCGNELSQKNTCQIISVWFTQKWQFCCMLLPFKSFQPCTVCVCCVFFLWSTNGEYFFTILMLSFYKSSSQWPHLSNV